MTAAPAIEDTGEITVAVEAAAWDDAIPSLDTHVREVVEAALAAASPHLGPAGIAVILTDDEAVRLLNRDWRGKDQPTNVLSFPAAGLGPGERPAPVLAGMPLELGDIVLAHETCRREAEAQGKLLLHHLDHLLVHGVLHLLGHDHQDEEEAGRMERLEIAILARRGILDPYAS